MGFSFHNGVKEKLFFYNNAKNRHDKDERL